MVVVLQIGHVLAVVPDSLVVNDFYSADDVLFMMMRQPVSYDVIYRL